MTSHSAEGYVNRPDSCSPPVAVSDIKIVSTDGSRKLPVGEVGELWASGPQVITGYWNSPEASAETFRNGWIRTGDLARLDEEGFCFVVDRAKDIVIRGGENIYSTEVENAPYEHPAVTDAALIGVPHRTLGEVSAAVVHLAPGTSASEDELKAWVRARLAIFKTPTSALFPKRPCRAMPTGKSPSPRLNRYSVTKQRDRSILARETCAMGQTNIATLWTPEMIGSRSEFQSCMT